MRRGTAGRAGPHSADLRRRVANFPWYHTMDLGQGLRTRGSYDPRRRLERLRLPARLDGLTVLDVGAWDGFFSFAVERRGAASVLAIDTWEGDWWHSKAGFDLAKEALQSRVESRRCDVMELSPEATGTFDLVLFLGVLYHLRDPLGALQRLASVTRQLLVVETEADLVGIKRPAAAFYPGAENGGDPTNWWAPNWPALRGMLSVAGFLDSTLVAHYHYPLRVARAWHLKREGREQFPVRDLIQRDRLVVHALKHSDGRTDRQVAEARSTGQPAVAASP